MKKRKLFCEISPLTYWISTQKCKAIRTLENTVHMAKLSSQKGGILPVKIYNHKSLIMRRLGNVNLRLQENKAINLSIAAPIISGIIIKPGETFSLWHLVGSCTKSKGYKNGLIISGGKVAEGLGGGMCQLSNLIHWMILHSPLEITEHHHHDGVDLFPDYGRQIPFGTGTSIMYNYLDYRFKNNTKQNFQLIIYIKNGYLCGELRSTAPLRTKYRVKAENEFFSRENDGIYRNGEVYRESIDKLTGNIISKKLIRKNHAKIMYDESFIPQNAAVQG